MSFVGDYEFKFPMYKKFMEKNECIRTNGRLENTFVYSCQAFQSNVINASTTYNYI